MSQPLTALLDNASVGTAVTCTLSAESVQVIFFALSFLEDSRAWKADYFDEITDAEQTTINGLIEGVTNDILP
jgi:hypothetical protein